MKCGCGCDCSACCKNPCVCPVNEKKGKMETCNNCKKPCDKCMCKESNCKKNNGQKPSMQKPGNGQKPNR